MRTFFRTFNATNKKWRPQRKLCWFFGIMVDIKFESMVWYFRYCKVDELYKIIFDGFRNSLNSCLYHVNLIFSFDLLAWFEMHTSKWFISVIYMFVLSVYWPIYLLNALLVAHSFCSLHKENIRLHYLSVGIPFSYIGHAKIIII